jgi:hypothetical protein
MIKAPLAPHDQPPSAPALANPGGGEGVLP